MFTQKFFATGTYRHLRGFVPAILISVAVFLVFIFAGAFFFYRGQVMMEAQLKDKLRSTAVAASMQFKAAEIVRIKDGDTVEKSPVLRDTAKKLQMIRESISSIRYAYIMARTDDPAFLKFVADADLALSDLDLDRNKNGVVDDDETASNPGDLYDWTAVSPALGQEAFLHPAVDEEIVYDQWGGTLSGYAPIRTNQGEVVGILGLDMSAEDYRNLSQSIFSPVAFLLMALAVLCVVSSTVIFLWKRRLESLERLEIERSGLMRLAFHQLGGPLTIISWSLQELEEDGPNSIQRTILNIHEGVKRLTNILKTLKDADLVHADKLEYKPEFASLTSVLKQVVENAGTRLALRKQKVRLFLEENITMNLDPKLIAGVADELLTNAIDFSKDGSEIIVRSKKDARSAIFEVQDFGCGIPKADLSRVFDEFTRGTNATKFKADGNGLGLYIVHGIIKRSGGTIDIRSREGEGTTVTVRLPIV